MLFLNLMFALTGHLLLGFPSLSKLMPGRGLACRATALLVLTVSPILIFTICIGASSTMGASLASTESCVTKHMIAKRLAEKRNNVSIVWRLIRKYFNLPAHDDHSKTQRVSCFHLSLLSTYLNIGTSVTAKTFTCCPIYWICNLTPAPETCKPKTSRQKDVRLWEELKMNVCSPKIRFYIF